MIFNPSAMFFGFRMRHLYYLKPFQDKLIGEIRDKLHEKGIMIVDVTSYPAMQQKEVDFIISFFENKNGDDGVCRLRCGIHEE